MKIITQIIKWSPIILSICIICYIIYYTVIDKSIYSNTNTAEENRGTLVSLFINIILFIIGYFMILYKIPIHFIIINYGFILSPVIEYLLDYAYGKNYGYNNFGTLKGIKYIFQNLVSINFYRYIITVLLDLFINNPIHDIIIDNSKNIINELNNDTSNFNNLSKLVATNFPTILQSLVGFLTFKAYTIKTRYNWAYTNSNSNNKPIDLIVIIIACSISACIFITYKSPNAPSFKIRIIYVIIIFLLILVGTELNILDNKSPNKIKSIIDKKYWWVGLIIFILFVIYGFIYPIFYTMMKKK